SGGNDGLNTLIPLDQYATLNMVRPNLMVPENSLLALSDIDDQALHPSLSGFQQLHEEGRLGIIQSVGYPNQNRSHFRSTDIWTSASDAEEVVTTGWLGRYFADDHPTFPESYPNQDYPAPFAIALGSQVSQTCQGTGVNFSMALNDPFNVTSLAVGGDTPVPDTPYGDELSFLRTSIAQTNAYGSTIQERAEAGNSIATYPDTPFANSLRNIAYMISGGLETKVYVVSLGGFDTHANQVVEGNPLLGEHADLLQIIGDGLAAFHADLVELGLQERVISMSFSEFGRRIRSNDSLGTDHGTAAPLFLMGDCVQSNILGVSPEISPDVDANEGVSMQYDFRDVYGTVLQDWFELSPTDVADVLGYDYIHLPILGACSTPTSTEEAIATFEADVFPNPFSRQIQVRFESTGALTDLAIFDSAGKRVKHLFSRALPNGPQVILVDLGEIPAGAYFVRLQSGANVASRRVVKK
ncbi:MAG: DUF1501 domain-containing protein, partial [Bacteroidota bacterium]